MSLLLAARKRAQPPGDRAGFQRLIPLGGIFGAHSLRVLKELGNTRPGVKGHGKRRDGPPKEAQRGPASSRSIS